MNHTTRRIFVQRLAATGTAGLGAVVGLPALAQAAPLVDEKSPQAAALGYAADTTKVDAKKYPKHTAEQKCVNCQLFAGKATDKAGNCPLFAGKQVTAAGWCSAYVKKA
ncbi:MAG: high-potential iron-sulfur protein [Hydrogenophaga sp.]|nr:high-potential iron-sulfur protein [Hydrogenophaga sp.]